MPVPVKANQVRVHTNSAGGRSYYIVVENTKNEYGALWFRSDVDKPLHLSLKFTPKEDDELIMDNIGVVRDTFLKLDPEYNDN